ncbi:MAG: GNAT family N-acetyltransferase [Flavobacteriales bacterium]|nr:GNAT family N-acetyltransferase [Flavobacteriales bacterium]
MKPHFQELSVNHISQIVPLVAELNPTTSEEILTNRFVAMFDYHHYKCFGLLLDEKILAVSSAWITTRLYSGKQIEIDNVVVAKNQKSKGLGATLLENMKEWARNNHCETMELNAYVQNNRAHKFYFKDDFKIIGYHFQKSLSP